MKAVLKLLQDTENDLNWFNKNYEDIKKKYENNFIAIENSEVIAFSKSFEDLIKELESIGKDTGKVLIRYVSKLLILY